MQEKGFTFLEQAYRRFFGFVADARLPARAVIAIPNLPARHSGTSMSAVNASLAAMAFEAALPPLRRVSCLTRGDDWVLADEHAGGRGIALNLWSRDRHAMEGLVDQLLIQFPEAKHRGRDRAAGR